MSAFIKETLNYRKNEFKRGIDSDRARRKREEESIQIRKQKRADNIDKKRREVISVKSNNPVNLLDPNNPVNLLEYDKVQQIWSNDPTTVLDGLIYLRKKLSRNKPPEVDHIINQIIQSNTVPKVIGYMTYIDYPDHQLEATWVMTNIISGDTEPTVKVLDNTPLISHCIQLLSTKNRKVRDQAIWCLGNVAGEGKKYKNILLDNAVLPIIVKILDGEISYEKRDNNMLRNQTWVLTVLLHKPYPPPSLTEWCLPVLKRLFGETQDKETLTNTAQCLSYITSSLDQSEMEPFLNYNIITPNTMRLLKAHDEICLPFLQACGSLIAGPDEVAQKVLDAGFFPYVSQLLSRKTDVKKETCWILSNIAAGNKSQTDQLINSGIIPMVCIILTNDTWLVKKECIYVFSNIVSNKNHQIDYIVGCGCIKILCEVLTKDLPVKMCKVVLDTLYGILKTASKYGKGREYANMIEDADGLDRIEYLQNHPDESIYKLSVKIVENFFDGNDYMDITDTGPITTSDVVGQKFNF